VVHATGPAQVEVIETLGGVVKAEVCWLSHRSQWVPGDMTEISEATFHAVIGDDSCARHAYLAWLVA
jgi:hypothetical protein